MPRVEQTAQAAEEEPRAGDALAMDTSTPSVPKGASDATPVDAALLEHVSILRPFVQNMYRVREQRSRWE